MKRQNKIIYALCLLALLVLFGGPLAAFHTNGSENAAPPRQPAASSGEMEQSQAVPIPPEESGAAANSLAEDGVYTSCEDVALYLHLYGRLPGNFITKAEARDLGWPGGGLEDYAPGQCIGGDTFGNYEGLLPEAEGRVYHECDIDTLGAGSRGAKRIVFSNDGLIYYTEDHYESFTLLYDEEAPQGP